MLIMKMIAEEEAIRMLNPVHPGRFRGAGKPKLTLFP